MKKNIYICTMFLLVSFNTTYARPTGRIKICTVHDLRYQEIPALRLPVEECNTTLGTEIYNLFHSGSTHAQTNTNKDPYSVVEPHNPECFSSHIITRL